MVYVKKFSILSCKWCPYFVRIREKRSFIEDVSFLQEPVYDLRDRTRSSSARKPVSLSGPFLYFK